MKRELLSIIEDALAMAGHKVMGDNDDCLIISDVANGVAYEISVEEVAS